MPSFTFPSVTASLLNSCLMMAKEARSPFEGASPELVARRRMSTSEWPCRYGKKIYTYELRRPNQPH